MNGTDKTDTRLIRGIQFTNYKLLRDTYLPLEGVTLLVGPNASGKSTALDALTAIRPRTNTEYSRVASLSPSSRQKGPVRVTVQWGPGIGEARTRFTMTEGTNGFTADTKASSLGPGGQEELGRAVVALGGFRVFSLDAKAIPAVVGLRPNAELEPAGLGLANVFDRMRDEEPERFERFNDELPGWLPEFDRVLFETPSEGARRFVLRSKAGLRWPADRLSDGTLIALAMMAIAYAPGMPRFYALEEPERGLHPRLLRLVRDTLFRVANPRAFNDHRPPAQVIVTTHSPVMLDLFRDLPTNVVVAQRDNGTAHFDRLSDRADLLDGLGNDSRLSDLWYAGILGGVPEV